MADLVVLDGIIIPDPNAPPPPRPNVLNPEGIQLDLERFDVRQFGSLGTDGVVNKATIDAALAAAAGGGEVVVPVMGIVPVASAPVVPSLVHFCGIGDRATRLQVTSPTAYAVEFGGTSSRISNFWIDAATEQTAGGGVLYGGEAVNRRFLDHIRFGDNLHTCIDMRSPVAGGHWVVDHINLDFVTGINTFLHIGNGTALVTDINISDIAAGAATFAGVNRWLWLHNNVDTPRMSRCSFGWSTNPSVIGDVGGSGTVTDGQFTDVALDNSTNELLLINNCRGLELKGMQINTAGGSYGVVYGAAAKDVLVLGGKTQNCFLNGEQILAGSKVRMIGRRIMDNNSSDNANAFGVVAVDNAKDFELLSVRWGNGDLAGHQKYGFLGGAGQDRYRIQNCTNDGNELGGIIDVTGAPATWKEVSGNH